MTRLNYDGVHKYHNDELALNRTLMETKLKFFEERYRDLRDEIKKIQYAISKGESIWIKDKDGHPVEYIIRPQSTDEGQ